MRDNLRVKEIRLDDTPGIRWVVCHNRQEAEREAAQRVAAVERITAELDRIAAARARARKTGTAKTAAGNKRKVAAEEAAHVRAECALR